MPFSIFEPIETKLMADAVFSEINRKGRSIKDAQIVAHTVMNRLKSPDKYGDGIPTVLSSMFKSNESFDRANKLKFKDEAEENLYKRVFATISGVLRGSIPDPTEGATELTAAKPLKSKAVKKVPKRVTARGVYNAA